LQYHVLCSVLGCICPEKVQAFSVFAILQTLSYCQEPSWEWIMSHSILSRPFLSH